MKNNLAFAALAGLFVVLPLGTAAGGSASDPEEVLVQCDVAALSDALEQGASALTRHGWNAIQGFPGLGFLMIQHVDKPDSLSEDACCAGAAHSASQGLLCPPREALFKRRGRRAGDKGWLDGTRSCQCQC